MTAATTAEQLGTASGAPGDSGRFGWRRWCGPLLLLVVSIGFVSLHVAAYTMISPVDELQHIDYLYKSPHVVAAGEQVGQQAMRAEACRGLDAPPTPLPVCSDTAIYDAGYFQEGGYNTAAINSPLYYTASHGVGAVLMAVGIADDLVDGARLAGGLWLGLGLVIAYAAGRRLGFRRVPLTAALLLLPVAAPILFFAATVTPDAMVVLAGAAALWAAVFVDGRPRTRWPVLVPVVAVVLLIKQTNVVMVGAVAVFLLVRAVAARRRVRDDAADGDEDSEGGAGFRWVALAAVVVTVLAVQVGWQWVSSSVALPVVTPMSSSFLVDRLPWDGVLTGLGQLAVLPQSSISLPYAEQLAVFLTSAVRLVAIAGLVGMAVFRVPSRRADPGRAIAQGALVLAVVGAPALILANYLTMKSYFAIPERYGYSLLPVMLVSAAGLARTRYARVTTAGVAGVLVVIAGWRLVAAG